MNSRFNLSRGARECQPTSAPRDDETIYGLGQPSEPLPPPAAGPCPPAEPEPGQEQPADAEPGLEEAEAARPPAHEPARARDEAKDDDPWRAPIPVEDARDHQAMAQEVMAAWRWVQRRRARGFKPC